MGKKGKSVQHLNLLTYMYPTKTLNKMLGLKTIEKIDKFGSRCYTGWIELCQILSLSFKISASYAYLCQLISTDEFRFPIKPFSSRRDPVETAPPTTEVNGKYSSSMAYIPITFR